MELPDLKQFKRYWLWNEHDNENGIDFADKRRAPVIYVLYVEEVVAYIGMSTNFWARLKKHKLNPREAEFTSFAFYEFEHATKGDLRIYEALYIIHYEPLWNKNRVTKYRQNEVNFISQQ